MSRVVTSLKECPEFNSGNPKFNSGCRSHSGMNTLMEKICGIEISILDQNENCLCYTLLFGSDKLNDVNNLNILNATIEYILSTERFNVPH